MEGKAGFYYFRELTGISLSLITLALIAPITYFIYIKYPNVFTDMESSCSVKGCFALFLLSAAAEAFLILVQISGFCCAILTSGDCRINCYHLITLLHFTAFLMLWVACLVYALKIDPNIWYWNTATMGTFTAMLNALYACIFQRNVRAIRRQETAESDALKMLQSTGGGLGRFIEDQNPDMSSHKDIKKVKTTKL